MQNNELIPFLVKNYNSEKNKYELGKEEIKIFNKNEFKKFLEGLPIQTFYESHPSINSFKYISSDYPYFPIEIYSEKLRFIKDSKETCSVSNTHLPIQFDQLARIFILNTIKTILKHYPE